MKREKNPENTCLQNSGTLLFPKFFFYTLKSVSRTPKKLGGSRKTVMNDIVTISFE